MGNFETQLSRCACLVANIEGWDNLAPPENLGSVSPPTVDSLHKRLRVLEARRHPGGYPISSEAPSPFSLAWRVSRLDRAVYVDQTYVPPAFRFTGSNQVHEVKKTAFEMLLGKGGNGENLEEHVLLNQVSDVVDDVAVRFCGVVPPVQRSDLTLDMLRQKIFYLAGRKKTRLETVPATTQDALILAVDLYNHLDGIEPPRGVHHPPPPPPPPFVGARGRPPFPLPPPPPGVEILNGPGKLGRKMCCGCCSCDCHPALGRRYDSDSDSDSDCSSAATTLKKEKKSSSKVKVSRWAKVKKVFGFGWVKQLACWRRKAAVVEDVDDDVSSIASSSSSWTR